MATNVRISRRKKFNREFVAGHLSGEIHYVYALVSRENRFVGYFGVTNDPKSRIWQHKKDTVRTDRRRSAWLDNNPSPPELVVLGAFPSRAVAELVERCLIRNFGGTIGNDYKYYNLRQANRKDVLDDTPFWMVGVDPEFVE